MKLIRPSYEVLRQEEGIEGIYKQIELAGRTCYHSEDKITPESAKKFVDMMIKSGHGAMLEHGTIYLKVPSELVSAGSSFGNNWTTLCNNPYTRYNCKKSYHYFTTNLRVIIDNDLQGVLEYLCEPTELHERRVTVKFICDRVTGESFLRHRTIDEDHPTIEGEVTRECEKDIDSFARESTRYCNYSKDKFGNQLSIIQPAEFTDEVVEQSITSWNGDGDQEMVFRTMCQNINLAQDDIFGEIDVWLFANLATEWAYGRLIALGEKPQQARRILPLDIKSPLVMTGFVSDWEHFFDLRCDQHAHPQARELAIPLQNEFISKGLIADEGNHLLDV